MKVRSAIGIIALAAAFPYLSSAQPTGTMVDPSVPMGVAPNPGSLGLIQPSTRAPSTPVPKLKHKDDLPKANARLHETAPGLVPSSPGATPSAMRAPTATPAR